jgi:CxxC-x17-CxxC domain-containing protein
MPPFRKSGSGKPRGRSSSRDSGRSSSRRGPSRDGDSFVKFEDRDRSREGSSRRSSGRSGGRSSSRDSGRGRSGGRRDSELEMHRVICDECGKSCEVPFKPTSSKPIYCSNCFKKDGKDGKVDNSKAFKEIHEKLDKIMEALNIE